MNSAHLFGQLHMIIVLGQNGLETFELYLSTVDSETHPSGTFAITKNISHLTPCCGDCPTAWWFLLWVAQKDCFKHSSLNFQISSVIVAAVAVAVAVTLSVSPIEYHALLLVG